MSSYLEFGNVESIHFIYFAAKIIGFKIKEKTLHIQNFITCHMYLIQREVLFMAQEKGEVYLPKNFTGIVVRLITYHKLHECLLYYNFVK